MPQSSLLLGFPVCPFLLFVRINVPLHCFVTLTNCPHIKQQMVFSCLSFWHRHIHGLGPVPASFENAATSNSSAPAPGVLASIHLLFYYWGSWTSGRKAAQIRSKYGQRIWSSAWCTGVVNKGQCHKPNNTLGRMISSWGSSPGPSYVGSCHGELGSVGNCWSSFTALIVSFSQG